MGMAKNLMDLSSLLSFSDVSSADWPECESLLAIRNESGVRKNMYTGHVISNEEHRKWLKELRRREDRKFFVVHYNGELVGGVGLSSIDKSNARADWSFYLTESVRGRGVGAALEFKFLEYVFNEECILKLNCEVISWNEPVIRLHRRFGFTQEGLRRGHVRRDGEFHDVAILGIYKFEWLIRRDEIMNGNKEKDTLYYLDIIDKIQEIRGKNNKNWMDLLRLSFQLAPREAAEIVSKIYEDDGEISALAKKLTE